MNEKQIYDNIPWDLIVSSLKEELTDEQRQTFAQWSKRQENQEIYAEICKLWEIVQGRCRDYIPDKNVYWKELASRLEWQEASKEKTLRSHKHFTVFYKYLAIASCVLLLVLSFYTGMFYGKGEDQLQVYKTMNGKSKVVLPDGTLVWLHAYSELSYGTRYGDDCRDIYLNGEAYFEVFSDAQRPFVVHTEDLGVKVYGTKFNVESFPGKDEIAVSLLEGSVAMQTVSDNYFLVPGETGVYNKSDHKVLIKKDDVNFASSWAKDKLYFYNHSLGEVARFLSKWYDVTIHVDPVLAERYAYTFTLHNEPLEEIMRLMSRIHPIEYHFNERNELYISPE